MNLAQQICAERTAQYRQHLSRLTADIQAANTRWRTAYDLYLSMSKDAQSVLITSEINDIINAAIPPAMVASYDKSEFCVKLMAQIKHEMYRMKDIFDQITNGGGCGSDLKLIQELSIKLQNFKNKYKSYLNYEEEDVRKLVTYYMRSVDIRIANIPKHYADAEAKECNQ
ncbi:MAG: hypothetical protein HQK53_11580 [Oligoflexia bacterium]|nr:hypothetical protein [Oligoflexia bacterium]